jgi:protein-S-isoprenylcysteine O-methyltransferase Ste14
MLKDPGPVQIIACIVNAIALLITALIEENEMIEKFGEEYRMYMRHSKMFIPFII